MSAAKQHKSTTHEEMFFHIREPYIDKKGKRYKAATVFARMEPDVGCWLLVPARCSETDNFCRRTGRNVARKRYFQFAEDCYDFVWLKTKPTYEDAKKLYMSI